MIEAGANKSMAQKSNSYRWERLRYFVHLAKRNPLFIAGLVATVLIVCGGIFAPWMTPFPEDARFGMYLRPKLIPPCWDHFFGTDDMGRDIFSRVVFGTRASLLIGSMTLLMALCIGVPLGLVAGYFGGRVNEVIMRMSDIFMSFPPMLLPLVISSVLGPSIRNTIIALGITWFASYVRLVRGQVLTVREQLYVDAARSIGVRPLKILARHVLPNSVGPVIVKASMDLGFIILIAAALSFIGLGAQPPTVEWGLMITGARAYFLDFWWTVTFPGLAIFVTVLSFNLIGDGLRDILDPKVRD